MVLVRPVRIGQVRLLDSRLLLYKSLCSGISAGCDVYIETLLRSLELRSKRTVRVCMIAQSARLF